MCASCISGFLQLEEMYGAIGIGTRMSDLLKAIDQ